MTPKLDATKAEEIARLYIHSSACKPSGVSFFEALQTAYDAHNGNWSIRCKFMCVSLTPSMRIRLVVVQDSSGKVVGGNEEVAR